MSTLSFAAIIVAFIVFLFIIFSYINKRDNNRARNILLSQLSKFGVENNLSFSSQEILNGSIIGLDAISLKLLILRKSEDDKYESNIIDLSSVKNCFVKKLFKPVYNDDLQKHKIENYLSKIILQFEFINNSESAEIVFYKHITDNIYQMRELEVKAKKWEVMLLQLVGHPLSLRA